METSSPQDRKVIHFFYDLVLILSGLLTIELLWESGFYLDNTLIFMGLWLLFAILLYLPRRARSPIVP